jgi:phosphoribosylglycinamide formyltransferase-1
MLKVAVLISGGGTNLQSLIDEAAAPDAPFQIIQVISNVSDAHGLERARKAGIETRVVDHKQFDGRQPFEDALLALLSASGAELVCLAGFMRLLTDHFVNQWHDRLINIHPSLLPSFKGLDTHRRAIDAGVRFAGCTIHFVRPAMDDGPIIIQAAVPVLPDDTAESLAGRVLAEEHLIYPLAVRLIALGRVEVVGARVEIVGAEGPGTALINPAG